MRRARPSPAGTSGAPRWPSGGSVASDQACRGRRLVRAVTRLRGPNTATAPARGQGHGGSCSRGGGSRGGGRGVEAEPGQFRRGLGGCHLSVFRRVEEAGDGVLDGFDAFACLVGGFVVQLPGDHVDDSARADDVVGHPHDAARRSDSAAAPALPGPDPRRSPRPACRCTHSRGNAGIEQEHRTVGPSRRQGGGRPAHSVTRSVDRRPAAPPRLRG